jgi:putative nucleotidyltransferase with HDIG domain
MDTKAATTAKTAKPRPWVVQSLPPFPHAVSRFVALLSRDEVGAGQLAGVVRMDPALGAAILRLVNSAAYGSGARIDSLTEAILRVGTERLKGLAYTFGIGTYLKGAKKQQAHKLCCQHSIACGFLAQELAAPFGFDRDRAYTAGLLHDIGRLALLAGYPKQYSALVTTSIEDALALIEAERAMFDVDHCEVGGYLASDWDFSDDLRDAIVRHHAVPPPDDGGLAALVNLACRLTDALGFQVAPPEVAWNLDQLREALPETLKQSWQPDLADLAQATARKVEATQI